MATIPELVNETVEAAGCEVVQLKNHPKSMVTVLVDRVPDGVNVNDLTSITRSLNEAFEEAGLDPGEYTIEVLSPGLDRPLVREKDFVRFAGEKVHIKLKEKRPVDGRKNFKGVLVELKDGVIVVENPDDADEPFRVLRSEAREVRIVPTFPKFKDPVPKHKRTRKPRKAQRKRPKRN
jgi:ribosome maturation factor RimP